MVLRTKALGTRSRFIAMLAVLIWAAALAQTPAGRQSDASARLRQSTVSASPSAASLFLPPVTIPSGPGNPFQGLAVAVADVNGDRNPDIVVANLSSDTIAILIGNGDGTFQQRATYELGGTAPSSVAVADVDSDGKPDLVVGNYGTSFSFGGIGVLLGNGDGTFQSAKTYNSGGRDTYALAVEDVNGDGKPDVVTSTFEPQSWGGAVGVLLGNGDGTFQPPRTFLTGGASGAGVPAVAVADVNGDGKPDITAATLDWYCSSTQCGTIGAVAVLLGNGDGTFPPAVLYRSGGVYSRALTVVDVSGDGKPDIVVENLQSGSVYGTVGVLLGNGDGTFRQAVRYRSGEGGNGSSVAVADVNTDGKLDIVATDEGAVNSCNNQGVVGVLLGNGDGIFQAAQTYCSGGFRAESVAIADLNGDSAPDVVVANICGDNLETCEWSSLAILLNNRSNRVSATTTILNSSLNPSVVGQAVTFTATVTSSAGIPPNGETITFYNGIAVLGTAPLSDGAAVLTTSALPAGVFTITAGYPGDSTFAASTSAGLRQTVNATSKSATATTLASSLNPSIYGQKVTFMAQVTTSGPVPPTGTVAFMWRYFTQNYTIGTATLNSAGVATLTKSDLNASLYPMIAVYRGDTNNLSSTSPALKQTVLQTTSKATITSSVNPSTVGHAVTFTAKITSPTVVPSGPVTFKAGTTVLGTAQLGSGKAIFTISTLPAGSTVVKVIYNGNSNIKGSSATVTQTVEP